MAKLGIDKIGFYTSHYYLDLEVLAKQRNIDVNKFHVGLGQRKMSLPAPGEDVVTMAANAAQRVLKDEDLACIDTLLFATETAVDQAKGAGTSLHKLLALSARCRTVELKQACYGGTAALQMAAAMVQRKPDKKVLIVAADIARYGIEQQGESTQGCAAVAMLVSINPRILALEEESGLFTEDVFDFWRPNHRREALIEGKYSTKMYLRALQESWQHYQEESHRSFADHDYFIYHTSVPRLVEKAHIQLAKSAELELNQQQVAEQLNASLEYGREIGNAYTAAMYVSLISLLNNTAQNMAGKRIAFYSYGSGCVGECFSGVVQKSYRQCLDVGYDQQMLASREALTYPQYEFFYHYKLPDSDETLEVPGEYETGDYRLARLENHRRIYEKKLSAEVVECLAAKAISPAKLILSGEHSVVYGCPAIALAVERFVETTVLAESENAVSFNLFNLQYQKSVALQTLRALKTSLKRKYDKFLRGECTIRDVLKQPFHLAQFSAIHLLDHVSPKRVHGLKIETKSDIPVGCGMGSSAAVTLSVLRAITQHYSFDLDKQQFLDLAFESERLQHGYPSQLDLQISFHGGCIYFHNGKIEQRALPSVPMFLVNTGIPDASTGECVAQVAKNFAQDAIWDRFANVTEAFDQALQKNDLIALQNLVKENHRLLNTIGVVPAKTANFIAELEDAHCAAKICGAGSVKGDQAGMVLVLADNIEIVQAVCERYAYQAEPLKAAAQGLRVEA